jgi:two-component system response regulator AtoC
MDMLPADAILFGQSKAMGGVRQRARKVCDTNVPVLLCGPGGSGKELLARWIHKNSGNGSGQFVKVNCAAIPGTLLESELFGYERGAFTGAHVSKPGRVELAHKGTLFLDEIAEFDSGLQSKLLHFLQDGRFSRIGGHEENLVETRVICATSKNLQAQIDAGTFRADLYFRINVVQIRLPGLKERSEDIPDMAEYFRMIHQKAYSKPAEPLDQDTLQYLQNREWPGNIRELSNVIARYVVIGPDGRVFQESMAGRMLPALASRGAISLKQFAKEAVREREKGFIVEALRANQWNRRKTARALKISYRSLIYKIRNAGLPSRRATRREFESEPFVAD